MNKYALAKNPNTPVNILTLLSQDKDEDVRYYVAKNSNTPVKILVTLCQDKDEDTDVRYCGAKNLNFINKIK